MASQKFGPSTRRCTVLNKREKQAMLYADRLARSAGAFSISYVVTPRRLTVLTYYNKPNLLHGDDAAAAKPPALPKARSVPAAAAAAAHSRTRATPVSLPPGLPVSRVQKQAPQKQAPQRQARAKPASRIKTDRNSLSARSGVILSDAAIAAQARSEASSSSSSSRPAGKPSLTSGLLSMIAASTPT